MYNRYVLSVLPALTYESLMSNEFWKGNVVSKHETLKAFMCPKVGCLALVKTQTALSTNANNLLSHPENISLTGVILYVQ